MRSTIQTTSDDLTQTLDNLTQLASQSDVITHESITKIILSVNSTIDELKKLELLNSKNLFLMNTPLRTIISETDNLERQKLYDDINAKLKDIYLLLKMGLLVQQNFELVMTGTFIDKSCSVRGFTPGHTQQMWSHCCVGVESKIANMIYAGKSLIEIFEFARNIRRVVGDVLHKMDYRISSYGRLTININGRGDIFSGAEIPGVIGGDDTDNELFIPIRELALKTYNQYKYTENNISTRNQETTLSSMTRGCMRTYPTLELNFKRTLASPTNIITLPEAHLKLYMNPDDNNELLGIWVGFDVRDATIDGILPVYQVLAFFKPLLDKIRNKIYDFNQNEFDNDFLTELASVNYFLIRSYPLMNGTASVVQWITRGIALAYSNGQVDLKDLRLHTSNTQSTTYDIYAQICPDIDNYVIAFKEAVTPYFNRVSSEKKHYESMGKLLQRYLEELDLAGQTQSDSKSEASPEIIANREQARAIREALSLFIKETRNLSDYSRAIHLYSAAYSEEKQHPLYQALHQNPKTIDVELKNKIHKIYSEIRTSDALVNNKKSSIEAAKTKSEKHAAAPAPGSITAPALKHSALFPNTQKTDPSTKTPKTTSVKKSIGRGGLQ